MGMLKLDYIRRAPGIGDYNRLVEAINWLIDKAQEKKEVVHIKIEREVKDYSFFYGGEVDLPFVANYLLTTLEDAIQLFGAYAFTFKETTQINDAIMHWNIVAVDINVTEKITEKEKKQEVIFETVEAVPVEEKPKKKKGRKKKTSRN